MIDGVRFRVRTGVPWRDVPAEYGPWSRSYDLFHRWRRDGTWHEILTRLQPLAVEQGQKPMRYDKPAVRYEATVLVAAVNERL
ncbi:transposase [Streptomyces sp. NPDC006197]|uniref:transposase n=1 Tax=Streptomyces sp. NPDC006197 TaxID=3156685 RepID=UPI0033AF3840